MSRAGNTLRSAPCARPASLRFQDALPGILIPSLLLLFPLSTQASGLLDLWLTPDQQAQRLYEQGNYLEAAGSYEDPARRAAAYYRAGEFEQAASLYGAIGGAEAAYNRGNALVLLGRYEEAIASYEKALGDRPDWAQAQENRAIARVRFERIQPSEDDAGGTGGKMESDEIRFDDTGRVNRNGTEVETEGGDSTSEEAMRAVWLRRVQGDPADFLRVRFAYQLYRAEQEVDDAPSDDP